MCSPAHNAVLVNVYLGEFVFFQHCDKSLCVYVAAVAHHLRRVAANEAAVVFRRSARIRSFYLLQIRRGVVEPRRLRVQVYYQYVGWHGLSLDAQRRQVFDALEKHGVQVRHVQLELQQVAIQHAVVVVGDYLVDAYIRVHSRQECLVKLNLPVALQKVFLHCFTFFE